jgi:hypothetical protein
MKKIILRFVDITLFAAFAACLVALVTLERLGLAVRARLDAMEE